jgi:hypothetical protein
VHPRPNRAVVFDARHLHGVIPGTWLQLRITRFKKRVLAVGERRPLDVAGPNILMAEQDGLPRRCKATLFRIRCDIG